MVMKTFARIKIVRRKQKKTKITAHFQIKGIRIKITAY